jgi:hypothetical protein
VYKGANATSSQLFGVYNDGTASTSKLTISGISGCNTTSALTTNSSGVVSCGGISGGGAAYAFTSTGNATSTLTQFNGGLTAYASTTIGDGTQIGGVTISGGSTTTLNAYVGSTLKLGVPVNYDTGDIQFLNSSNSVVGRIAVPSASDFWLHNNSSDAFMRLTLSTAYDNTKALLSSTPRAPWEPVWECSPLARCLKTTLIPLTE